MRQWSVYSGFSTAFEIRHWLYIVLMMCSPCTLPQVLLHSRSSHPFWRPCFPPLLLLFLSSPPVCTSVSAECGLTVEQGFWCTKSYVFRYSIDGGAHPLFYAQTSNTHQQIQNKRVVRLRLTAPHQKWVVSEIMATILWPISSAWTSFLFFILQLMSEKLWIS